MTFTQLLLVIKARWRTALAVFSALVLVVGGYTAMQAKQYVATAAVMVDVRADPVAAAGGGYAGPSSAQIATQVDLIQSERVALGAVRNLQLSEDANWRRLWSAATGGRGEYQPWLAEQLLKGLDVRPSRDSNVVNIAYAASDAAFAAQMANAFVRSYIDTALELRVEPARQYNAFFDDSTKRLRALLEESQQRLSAYQQAKGIIATDDRLDVETARLQELSSQVVLLQGVAAESAGRQGLASANSPEVMSNPSVVLISGDLARLEARLFDIRQRLGEANPQVIDLTAGVEQLRARLERETRKVAGSLSTNSSVDRSRLAAAQGALTAQRARVLGLRDQRDQAAVLQRDLDNAQKAYDASLARLTQTGLESRNTQTNVAVLKTASVPPLPASPRLLLNVAVACVLGLLLAVCTVVATETLDRRLRFERDVVEVLGQTLLTRLPRGNVAAAAARSPAQRKVQLVNSVPQAS